MATKQKDILKELRPMGADQLAERAKELRNELFKLRTQAATAKVDDTSKARKIRREIAQVLTLQRELQLKSVAK